MLITPKGSEVGIDEAGRGCLWGPMFAGAVLLKESKLPDSFREIAEEIKDSKKITAKRRAKLFQIIKSSGVPYGIGIVSAKEIDTLGATRANQLAFRRALDAIGDVKGEGVNILIDGILGLREEKEGETWKTEIDGDARFLSIATASILAKESHDDWVRHWCEEHSVEGERYDLMSCKGYGTLKHRVAIKKDGLHEEHRRLYCRKLIPGLEVIRYEFVD